MENDIRASVSLLKQGLAPNNSEILKRITVGTNTLMDFMSKQYFNEYISLGGSKIKFVTGKTGSGKTHFLQMMTLTAKNLEYLCVHFSAKDIWLHDFKEIYSEIFKKSDIMMLLSKCAVKIIEELGYEPSSIPSNITFIDYLSSIGELDILTKKEIRNLLRKMFLQNPLIDNNFAKACCLIAGGILGHPSLEDSNSELLISWMSGSKDVKLSALRNLGLSPAKITKYNARHMLRSLAEVCRIAGVSGILVTIDDVDILVKTSALDTIRYTKLKREDAYECIRELIDEIDTLRGVMFFFAFERTLVDDELSGIKSYQALWMRVQNEIVSSRFNRFTDIIDLDRFAAESFDKDSLFQMSERIAHEINMVSGGASIIEDAAVNDILNNAKYSKVSIPRKVVLTTVHGHYNPED